MSVIEGLNDRLTRVEEMIADVVINFDDLGRRLRDLTTTVANLQRAAETSAAASNTRVAPAAAKSDVATKTSGKTT